MPTYDFFPITLRAQCLNVVDGDTIDVLVDRGFRDFSSMRLRLAGIDAPELRDKNPTERARAQEAKDWLKDLLKPLLVRDAAILSAWPLRIITYKDPDSFWRWIADVWVYDPQEANAEIHVNARLIELGLAKAYRR